MNSKDTNGQPPPRPTIDAEVESAAIAAQVLETGSDEKNGVIEHAEQDESTSSQAKKVPEAGMKNYFVSKSPWMLLLADKRSASLLAWNCSRLLAHIYVLCYLDSLRRYVSSDECRLRYDLILQNLLASSANTDNNQVN